MFVKTSQVITGLTLALSISAVAIAPVKAEPKNEEVLLSQLNGYDFNVPFEIYKQDWVQFRFEDDIVIGRVRGKAGDFIAVELLSPEMVMINDKEITHVNLGGAPYSVTEGNDVILKYTDDGWVMLDDAQTGYDVKYSNALPAWVSRLELKEAEVKQIDFGTSSQVDIAPAPQSTTVYQEPTAAPVRGLW